MVLPPVVRVLVMWVVVKIKVPFWLITMELNVLYFGTYYLGYPKGTLILTTTHVAFRRLRQRFEKCLGIQC